MNVNVAPIMNVPPDAAVRGWSCSRSLGRLWSGTTIPGSNGGGSMAGEAIVRIVGAILSDYSTNVKTADGMASRSQPPGRRDCSSAEEALA